MTIQPGPSIFTLSSDYVDAMAANDPFHATFIGITTHESEVPDYSPAGAEATRAMQTGFRDKARTIDATNDSERIARDVLIAQIDQSLASLDANDWQSSLNIIESPIQAVRDVFDHMGATTSRDWESREARLQKLPAAIDGYRASLEQGMRTGNVAAKRQVAECAKQCEVRGAAFHDVVSGMDTAPISATLRSSLATHAETAGRAYLALGRWLRETYLPSATSEDGVGIERYALEASRFCGSPVDLADTYAWGLDQVAEISEHMKRVANEIMPGESVRAVMDELDTNSDRAIHGESALVAFLQDHMDRMLDVLDGEHFDITVEGRRIQQMIAPPGGAAAQYYTAPSEDWSRPGRCWFPTGGKTVFPIWGEITTANHEGVPGHHLQAVASMASKDRLTRFQRQLFLSGHGEGWALYAERLCFELGLLDKPEYVLGWLNGQMLRAIRVVVDIGMHCGKELGLRVPADSPVCGGQEWNGNTGLAYAQAHLGTAFDLSSEIDRYLGWPGQAISYKVGEREWLRTRDDAKLALGSRFELKEFHTTALSLGALGLDQLRVEVLRALTS